MTAEPDTRGRRSGLLPTLPRPAWVVLGGDFVSAIGSGLTLPFLFIYAHRVRDLSYGTAGLVVATIALASLVGNPLGGAVADRWTPRRALMAGLDRHLPPAANQITAPATTPSGPAQAGRRAPSANSPRS